MSIQASEQPKLVQSGRVETPLPASPIEYGGPDPVAVLRERLNLSRPRSPHLGPLGLLAIQRGASLASNLTPIISPPTPFPPLDTALDPAVSQQTAESKSEKTGSVRDARQKVRFLGHVAAVYVRNLQAQFGNTLDRFQLSSVQLSLALDEYRRNRSSKQYFSSKYVTASTVTDGQAPVRTIPPDQVEAFLQGHNVAMPENLLGRINEGEAMWKLVVYGIVDEGYPVRHAAERAWREIRALSQQIGQLVASVFKIPSIESPSSKRQPRTYEPHDTRHDLPPELRPQRTAIEAVAPDPLGPLTENRPGMEREILKQADFGSPSLTPSSSRPGPGMDIESRKLAWNQLGIDDNISAVSRTARREAPDASTQEQFTVALNTALTQTTASPGVAATYLSEVTAGLTQQQLIDFVWLEAQLAGLKAIDASVGSLIELGVDITSTCLSIAASALQDGIAREVIIQSLQSALLALRPAQIPPSKPSQGATEPHTPAA